MTENPVKRYRTKQGLTLKQFAALFPVDKSTALRWERGRVPAERVLQVEEKTGIPRQALRPDLYGEAA